jgi:hypothetical protein
VKKIIIFLAFLLPGNQIKAQTLETLFLQLPDTCLRLMQEGGYLPLDTKGRAALLSDQSYDGYELIVNDASNAYFRFLTTADTSGFVVEMTYWKLKNGARLVGLNIMAADLDFLYTKRIFWLKYEQGKWTDLTAYYLPDVQFDDFYIAGKAPTEGEAKTMRWLFSLPRSGVNITIKAPETTHTIGNNSPEAFYEMQWVKEKFQLVRQLHTK